MPEINIPISTTNPDLAISEILFNLHVGVTNKLKTRVGEAANFAVTYMKSRAHVRTGHMKRNIQQQVVSPNEVNVLAKARYSGWENKRGSYHAFFEMGIDATVKKYPDLVISDIVSLIRNPQIVRKGVI